MTVRDWAGIVALVVVTLLLVRFILTWDPGASPGY